MLVDKNLPPASLASSSSLPDYYSCTTFNSEFEISLIFFIKLFYIIISRKKIYFYKESYKYKFDKYLFKIINYFLKKILKKKYI